MTEPLFVAAVSGSTTAWIVVYVLMIRRGLIDKSYGMPVTALCVNLSWEFYFTFLAGGEASARLGNGLFLLFDLGVLYTCLRFGKDDFDWPILKNHFRAFVAAMLPVALPPRS